jgi:prophage antirepressor-like protein
MGNLVLVKSEKFGEVKCDFYADENQTPCMTISQLSESLGYASKDGVEKVLSRNEYLKNDEFSGTYKLSVPQGNGYSFQETRVFTEDGIYEVTMLAKTEKAKTFRAWVRKILKGLRTGTLHLAKGKTPEQHQLELDTRARNARVRQGNFMLKVADKFKSYLSKESVQGLVSEATAVVLGREVIEKPIIDSGLVSKTDLAKRLGTNKNTLGKFIAKLTDANGDSINNNSKYGMSVLDKKAHCDGQVPVFKLNTHGVKLITDSWEKRSAV